MNAFLARRLIDGHGAAPLEQAVLLEERGQIVQIGSRAEVAIPEAATVHEVETLLPGLIDAHVHLAYSGAIEARAFRAEASEMSYPKLALRAAGYARETLEWGVTAVRDLNAPGGVIIDLRDAINAGYVPGPRVSACGLGLSVTGGHMDKGGWGDHVQLTDMNLACDGALEWRAAVRAQVKRGADVIKINLCGGSYQNWERPYKQEMDDSEIVAAIDEAHRLERRVAAHTSGGPAVTKAVKSRTGQCGARTLARRRMSRGDGGEGLFLRADPAGSGESFRAPLGSAGCQCQQHPLARAWA